MGTSPAPLTCFCLAVMARVLDLFPDGPGDRTGLFCPKALFCERKSCPVKGELGGCLGLLWKICLLWGDLEGYQVCSQAWVSFASGWRILLCQEGTNTPWSQLLSHCQAGGTARELGGAGVNGAEGEEAAQSWEGAARLRRWSCWWMAEVPCDTASRMEVVPLCVAIMQDTNVPVFWQQLAAKLHGWTCSVCLLHLPGAWFPARAQICTRVVRLPRTLPAF